MKDLTDAEENKQEIAKAERIAAEEEAKRAAEEAARVAELTEQFDEFYRLIVKAYEVWCRARGDSQGMYDTVQALIDARDAFCKKK